MDHSLKTQTEIKAKWEELKREQPSLRIRDSAEILGISEMELLLTERNSDKINIRLLDVSPAEILARLKDLGYVMALSRNDSCVHERKGIYGDLELNGQMGLILGEDIDLRIFLSHWKYALAIEEKYNETEVKRSLQFFDTFGRAIHKIHLNAKSNLQSFLEIKEKYGMMLESLDALEFAVYKQNSNDHSTISVGIEFLQDWSELKDTHDFFGLLRKHKISRLQSMVLAEGRFTKRLDTISLQILLDECVLNSIPIMVFVYNPGIVQIHTGAIKNVKVLGSWLNILDSEFNLHLNQEKLAEIWWVSKPTNDGEVQSVEVYDHNKQLVVQFFGKRKPGFLEREDWRAALRKILC
ncbi:MAG: hemin-degrading factor [Leptospiraceae bacterium]|nr:hemin-degrading factor [Leptospiraceae bacterium]MCZ8344813.1 hemin-degrading factor [Leptospiraceae bacterium]